MVLKLIDYACYALSRVIIEHPDDHMYWHESRRYYALAKSKTIPVIPEVLKKFEYYADNEDLVPEDLREYIGVSWHEYFDSGTRHIGLLASPRMRVLRIMIPYIETPANSEEESSDDDDFYISEDKHIRRTRFFQTCVKHGFVDYLDYLIQKKRLDVKETKTINFLFECGAKADLFLQTILDGKYGKVFPDNYKNTVYNVIHLHGSSIRVLRFYLKNFKTFVPSSYDYSTSIEEGICLDDDILSNIMSTGSAEESSEILDLIRDHVQETDDMRELLASIDFPCSRLGEYGSISLLKKFVEFLEYVRDKFEPIPEYEELDVRIMCPMIFSRIIKSAVHHGNYTFAADITKMYCPDVLEGPELSNYLISALVLGLKHMFTRRENPIQTPEDRLKKTQDAIELMDIFIENYFPICLSAIMDSVVRVYSVDTLCGQRVMDYVSSRILGDESLVKSSYFPYHSKYDDDEYQIRVEMGWEEDRR